MSTALCSTLRARATMRSWWSTQSPVGPLLLLSLQRQQHCSERQRRERDRETESWERERGGKREGGSHFVGVIKALQELFCVLPLSAFGDPPSLFNCLLDQNRPISRRRPQQQQQLSICNINPSPSSSSSSSSSCSFHESMDRVVEQQSSNAPRVFRVQAPLVSPTSNSPFLRFQPWGFWSPGVSWKAQNLNLA